ncbi:MAG: permease [Acidobacteriota bacterium]
MAWLNLYLQALADLIVDLWFYFLLGFLIAGAVAEFIPKRTLTRYLGRNSVGTLLRATLSGTVASLCSCGAIPIAVTMRKGGASRAAALTFMLAAPWAGFMQLVIFYKFLGFAGAAVVFVGALTVAFLTGIVLGRLEDHGWFDGSSRLDTDSNAPYNEVFCSVDLQSDFSLHQRIIGSLREAWEGFLGLWKYLAIGLVLAAILKAFIPTQWVASYLGSSAPLNPVLIAIPVAAAVELCSEGFSIFAGQLHQMGATLAVVFVVVLVGVSTDFTELSVIIGKFGKRCAIAYLSTATALALAFALIIQRMPL